MKIIDIRYGKLFISTNSMMLMATMAMVSLCLGAAVFTPGQAYATKSVDSPYVEEGELELQFEHSTIIDADNDTGGAHKQTYSIGYGVTDWWYTEGSIENEKEGEKNSHFSITHVEWENRFQLTEEGQCWVDVGLLAEAEFDIENGGPNELRLALLLEKSVCRFSHTAHIGFEKEIGRHAEEEFGSFFAWRSKYCYLPCLELGIELYSEFGPIPEFSDWDEQEHQLDPVIYGQVGPFRYDIGYLFGLTHASPDGEVKVNLEYGIEF